MVAVEQLLLLLHLLFSIKTNPEGTTIVNHLLPMLWVHGSFTNQREGWVTTSEYFLQPLRTPLKSVPPYYFSYFLLKVRTGAHQIFNVLL